MKQLLFLVALGTIWTSGLQAAVVPFPIPDTYPTGTSGINWPLVAADFTGDDRVDLVLTRNYPPPGVITVLPGDGLGGFGEPVTTPLPAIPLLVTVGDYDEDGRLDLLGPVSPNQMQLFFGNGLGGFQSGPTLPGTARSLASADFDRDGHLDFARDFEGATVGVQVYRGNGRGSFVLWQTLVNPIWIRVAGLTATDLDIDGWPDLLYSAGGLTARLNSGSGFGPAVNTPTSGTLDTVTDCNQDGVPDALLHVGHGEPPDGMRLALGLGDGSFMQGPECRALLRQGRHYGTAVGDFTGDGRVDLLAGDGNGEAVFMSVLGGGLLRAESRYLVGGISPMGLDLDLGGTSEIVVGGSGAITVIRSERGELRAPRTAVTGGFGEVMATGDVNGDGRRDLIMSHRLSGFLVSVLLGTDPGDFQPSFTVPVTREARALALADLNGDGYDDLVVGSLPSNGFHLEVLLGSASGQLSHLADLHNGSSVAIYGKGLALADMDRDGDLDLVTSTFGPLSVLRNRGDATFEPPLMSGVGSGAVEAIVVEDFNLDLIPDVAAFYWSGTEDHAQSRLLLHMGTGGGSLAWVQSLDVDGNHPRAAAGLVDGDAWPDLLVTGTPGFHSGAGGLYHLRNSGGTFAIQYHDPVAPGGSVVAADFNGDGLVDVAAAAVPGRLELRVNDGVGDLTQVLTLPFVDSPYDILAADWVGGPQADLVALSSEANPSTIVLFENRTSTPTGVSGGPPGSRQIALRVAPNPVAGATTLHFELDSSTAVGIRIYDVTGRLIRELDPLRLGAGKHAIPWDGRNTRGDRAPAGVFLVKVVAGHREAVAKLQRLP